MGAFLFDSDFGIVVVNRNYDIMTINHAARSMLGIHGQGIGEDIVHLAEVPSGELKAALDEAFRSETPARKREFEIKDLATNAVRYLHLSCFPDRSSNKDTRVENVFVLVTDVSENTARLRGLESSNRRNEELGARLAAQNAELQSRQKLLIDGNNELTAANADLRSSNEHLLISAEEAEAAAEEVETLNEEMQATGEELETLNEELQATVEELNTTNEELAARSNELERLGHERDAELLLARESLATLRAVVERTPLIVCLLDKNRNLVVVSQEYQALYERNAGKLPGVHEAWEQSPSTLQLQDAAGRKRSFAVDTIPLPAKVADTMLLLRPLDDASGS